MAHDKYEVWRQHRHGKDPLQGYVSYFKGAQMSHLQEAPDGSRTVSTGRINNTTPDPGGVSYGSFQFTSQYLDEKGHKHEGAVQQFMRSEEFQPFADKFKDKNGHPLQVNSEAFKDTWRNISDPNAFERAQYDFAMKRYHEPQVARLEHHHIDTAGRSDAFDNAVTSASVQHGQNSTVVVDGMLRKAKELGKPVNSLEDREAILGIYEERARVNKTTVQRYASEMKMDLEMLARERGEAAPPAQRMPPEHARAAGHKASHTLHGDAVGETIVKAREDRVAPSGYVEPHMAAHMPGLNHGGAPAAAAPAATQGYIDPGMAVAMPGISGPIDALAAPLSIAPAVLGKAAETGIEADPARALPKSVENALGDVNKQASEPLRKRNAAGAMVDDYVPGMTPR